MKLDYDFRNLEIDDEQLETIFKLIKEKDKVLSLNFRFNLFTQIPEEILQFKSLYFLNLSYCKNLEFLGKLRKIGDLHITRSPNLVSLGDLSFVENFIYLNGSGITEEYVRKFKPWLFEKCRWW